MPPNRPPPALDWLKNGEITNSVQELGKLPEESEIAFVEPLGLEMHDVVADLPDFSKLLDKVLAVDLETEARPVCG